MDSGGHTGTHSIKKKVTMSPTKEVTKALESLQSEIKDNLLTPFREGQPATGIPTWLPDGTQITQEDWVKWALIKLGYYDSNE